MLPPFFVLFVLFILLAFLILLMLFVLLMLPPLAFANSIVVLLHLIVDVLHFDWVLDDFALGPDLLLADHKQRILVHLREALAFIVGVRFLQNLRQGLPLLIARVGVHVHRLAQQVLLRGLLLADFVAEVLHPGLALQVGLGDDAGLDLHAFEFLVVALLLQLFEPLGGLLLEVFLLLLVLPHLLHAPYGARVPGLLKQIIEAHCVRVK